MGIALSIKTANRLKVQTSEPSVARLPDGHVRVRGSATRFPEKCPRCGAFPARTEVKLRFQKFRAKNFWRHSSQSIKLPFCARCGRTLNALPYIIGLFGFLFATFVVPRIKTPGFSPHSILPSAFAVFLITIVSGGVIEELPRLFFKPGVQVLSADADSVDLAFDDPMYAEQFVLLNR
jgi:hypothetical protein